MRCVLVSSRLDLKDYLGGEIARIADRIDVVEHAAAEAADDVRLAVAWHPPDDAFARYPNLQAVCSIGAGVDNIMACPSLRPHIDVVRVVDPGQAQMMSGFVAWHVIGHQRGFAVYRAQQREKVWQRRPQRGADDVPVGILGNGEIGRKVAADLAQLGFPVMSWSRTAKPASDRARAYHGPAGLAAMLANTEVLVNLLPLTPETRSILNGGVFSKMRRGGYLVQVGRGEHLVEADLLAALDSGRLAGAALDVFATEPLPADHPLWRHPRIAVTPHIAAQPSVRGAVTQFLDNLQRVRTGQAPLHAVDRQADY